MLRLVLIVLASQVVVPPPAQQITVEQLDQTLADPIALKDADEARRISKFELSERLDADALAHSQQRMPGELSRRALQLVADASAFLDLPAERVSADPPPDLDTQRRIMSLVVAYVGKTIHKLPDLFATRTTVRFEGWPDGFKTNRMITIRPILPERVDATDAVVTYREGAEVVSDGQDHHRRPAKAGKGLYTWGLFGPVLGIVLSDAAHSSLAWSHWERRESGSLAVFEFQVPMEKSTYQVKYCCAAPNPSILMPIERVSAYHGEMTLDPDTGAVMRLTIMADLDQGSTTTLLEEAGEGTPLSRADLMVEYGPVDIGGKQYTCPIHSVSISRARVVRTLKKPHGEEFEPGPVKLFINDVSFTGYRVFRSESRIIANGVN